MADGGPDFGSSKSRSLPPVFAAQSSGWLSRLSILSQMAPQLDAAIGAHALSLRLVFSSCVITHSSISANRSLPSLPMRSPAACSTRTSALALSSRLERHRLDDLVRHRLDDLVQPEDAYPLNATPIWRSAPTAAPIRKVARKVTPNVSASGVTSPSAVDSRPRNLRLCTADACLTHASSRSRLGTPILLAAGPFIRAVLSCGAFLPSAACCASAPLSRARRRASFDTARRISV